MSATDLLKPPKIEPKANGEGKMCMHYGHFVDSETPIVGVVANNSVPWLGDEMACNHSVDLAWLEHKRHCHRRDHDMCADGNDSQDMLIGAWKRTFEKRDGKRHLVYVPDKSGEYSAHVGEVYTIVYWSQHTERHALCSPCYAGCGDIDSAGDFLCFVLPPELMKE